MSRARQLERALARARAYARLTLKNSPRLQINRNTTLSNVFSHFSLFLLLFSYSSPQPAASLLVVCSLNEHRFLLVGVVNLVGWFLMFGLAADSHEPIGGERWRAARSTQSLRVAKISFLCKYAHKQKTKQKIGARVDAVKQKKTFETEKRRLASAQRAVCFLVVSVGGAPMLPVEWRKRRTAFLDLHLL